MARSLTVLLFVAVVGVIGLTVPTVATPIPVPDTATDSLAIDTLQLRADSLAKRFRHDAPAIPEKMNRMPRLSPDDSIAAIYLRYHGNLRTYADWSCHRDMGDFFRASPEAVTFGRQITPSRKQVYPYGLDGNRMAFNVGGLTLSPLEPNPEPDGGVAMNDIPLAPIANAWLVPPSLSQLFTTDGALTTLYAAPWRFDDSLYHTSIHAQKGDYGYSDVRGVFAKRYRDGRDITAALGYRDADGENSGLSDDDYNYYANITWPVTSRIDMRCLGYLSNKHSYEQLWTENASRAVFRRTRFDRNVNLGVDIAATDTSLTSVLYTHERDGSYIDNNFKSRLNLTSHGGVIRHSRRYAGGLLTGVGNVRYTLFDTGDHEESRTELSGNLGYVDLRRRWNRTATIGFSLMPGFGFLPRTSASVSTSDSSLSVSFGVAYSEQAPSLPDLFLPKATGWLYVSSNDYTEEGNGGLKSEKQSSISVSAQADGRYSAGLCIVMGKIWDAVVWQPQSAIAPSPPASFSPVNVDRTFATVSVSSGARISTVFTLRGGGAWHYIDDENRDTIPYAPAYNLFTGGEIHINWRQTGSHLYAYGELSWTDSYVGYFGKTIGRDLSANAKLTFALKDFRLFFVFQNVFLKPIEQREYYPSYSRTMYYGISWWFTD